MTDNAKEWLIWSFKHGEWWGPDRCGYTRDLQQAGLYTKAEAGDIVLGTGMPNENVGMLASPRVPGWWQDEQEAKKAS